MKNRRFFGGNAGGVLPPVLQQKQRVIQGLIHWAMRYQPDNTAHNVPPFLVKRKRGLYT
jgi:hypothetical protein